MVDVFGCGGGCTEGGVTTDGRIAGRDDCNRLGKQQSQNPAIGALLQPAMALLTRIVIIRIHPGRRCPMGSPRAVVVLGLPAGDAVAGWRIHLVP